MDNSCPNCGTSIPSNANYCYQCGQKQAKDFLKIGGFLQNTLSTLFHYDSSFWRTFKYIFIPGKVTLDFLNGKRKKYLNPIRMFIFLALIYFVISAPSFINLGDQGQAMETVQRKYAIQTVNGNNAIESLQLDQRKSFPSDSIQKLYFSLISMGMIDSIREADTLMSLEELDIFQSGDPESWELDSLVIGLDFWPLENLSNKKIDYRDVYLLSPDSIISKYNITGFADKYALKQYLKITTSVSSYGDYLRSKITWTFFLLIPFQGIFMLLLYWPRTYIEHLIFLLHLHSLGFIILILVTLLMPLLPEVLSYTSHPGLYILIGIIGLAVYYYLATKRVYKDSHLINFIKMIPLFITYWVGVAISLLSVVVFSALLF